MELLMAPTAIITGGSGGIGRECARALADDHNVIIHYNSNKESASQLADELNDGDSHAGNAVIDQCDIADPTAVDEFVDRSLDEFGSIDVLVNNAAVFYTESVLDLSVEEIARTININLLGTMYVTRAILPTMIEQENGRIVTVSSTAGVYGSSTDPSYSASKAGVIGFSKSIANAYTEHGVFSNVVAPTATDTAMYAEERRPAHREKSPLGRLITPTEVAEAVQFLATTTCISGKVLEVDGAYH